MRTVEIKWLITTHPVIGRCDVLNEAYFVRLPPATTADYDAAPGDPFHSSWHQMDRRS